MDPLEEALRWRREQLTHVSRIKGSLSESLWLRCTEFHVTSNTNVHGWSERWEMRKWWWWWGRKIMPPRRIFKLWLQFQGLCVGPREATMSELVIGLHPAGPWGHAEWARKWVRSDQCVCLLLIIHTAPGDTGTGRESVSAPILEQHSHSSWISVLVERDVQAFSFPENKSSLKKKKKP